MIFWLGIALGYSFGFSLAAFVMWFSRNQK
jgi:hypothetical protein